VTNDINGGRLPTCDVTLSVVHQCIGVIAIYVGIYLVCSLTGTKDECPVMEIHLRANGDTDESGA
jgi:hypothetical protein